MHQAEQAARELHLGVPVRCADTKFGDSPCWVAYEGDACAIVFYEDDPNHAYPVNAHND